MITTEYDHIFDDFINASNTTNCDSRYVLRNLLSRGAAEANYRFFLSEGRKAQEYKQLEIELESLIDELPGMFDKYGIVLREHRATLRKALAVSWYLIAIEREETASQFKILEKRLKNPCRRRSYRELKAA
ncbi:hypothetical protein [Methylobacterium sp. PvR107]|uniref:hypothetical protein n=1 Tax=Methylobacterium sp. PvR107 TaxID=2806597 RepID=UPI001AE60DC8|nr:hypothetical protein [Methylobacterium sp. PvR107]MBP1182162.1 hypothetical protein [Methylobacterium sp. PvR107]